MVENFLIPISRMIEAINSNSFFAECSECLKQAYDSDDVMVTYYRLNAAPVMISTLIDTVDYKLGWENFYSHTYVLHPVFLAFNSNIKSGTYLDRELLPRYPNDQLINTGLDTDLDVKIDEEEVLGYLSLGCPPRQESLSMLINLPEDSMIEIAILRQSDIGFKKSEVTLLKQVFPIFKAAVRKHYEVTEQQINSVSKSPSLIYSFEKFGSEILTKREREVVKLMLTGHSGLAVSQIMGTSLSTAKTHRRNIYMKLEISSQAELFNIFIQFLSYQRAI